MQEWNCQNNRGGIVLILQLMLVELILASFCVEKNFVDESSETKRKTFDPTLYDNP